MVKKSKRRTFAADKYNSKTRADPTPKVNPFDLHVNRLKHDVLGKRRNYERGGQPLKARARGIEKRKRTLLKELNSVFKKSTFIDHRIGENDPTLTSEEKLMQRLIAERSKIRSGKESRYNLNDEEDLTHYGQSLSKSDELNQRPLIDDYDDDDLNKGRINSEHFFGGFQSGNDSQKPQTKKEWIEHMIKTTKLDKYERQRENEKIYDLTENLDEQWKALSTLMGIKDKKPTETKESADDYDKLVNALKFEAKTSGLPVKTIEEKERETAERLKNLQVEETQRMGQPNLKSILSKNRSKAHYSVEELDESYYIMDGSKKRVTFDEEDNNAQNETLPPVDTEQSNGNGDAEYNDADGADEEEGEGEQQQTNATDLIAEFDEIPSSLDILQDRLTSEKNTLNLIWKRINNSRLPPIPKSVLANYFDVLLDYYESVDFNQVLLNQIAKQLLQLLQLVNNEQIQTNILDRLKQHHDNLVEQIEQEKFAEINQSFILFLKLIAYLYPTSDFRHPITTPALTLLIQSIAHTSLKTLSSCRQSLFLIGLAKQWISKSHRYMPEVIVLFRKIFQLACPTEKSKDFISFPPKQISDRQLLVITKITKNKDKIDILSECLQQFKDFLNIYQSLSAISEILQPFSNLLQTITETSKCEQISSQCRDLLTQIESIQSTSLSSRQHLVQGKGPAKSLRLFEPRFGPVYEGKKNSRLPKEQAEHLRMKKKHKREFKATSRAIRLDNEFIAREELQQQMAKDAQRKRKVKELQAELSMQEGEFRKLQKLK